MSRKWDLIAEWSTVCCGVLLSVGTVVWGVWSPMPYSERIIVVGMGVFFLAVFVFLSLFRSRLQGNEMALYGRNEEEKREVLEGLAFGIRKYIKEREGE